MGIFATLKEIRGGYPGGWKKYSHGKVNHRETPPFVQPTDPDGGVARFIQRRGEGVHHVAFEVEDLQASLDALGKHGVRLIDTAPREGLSGMIGFIHPRSTRGVLIELVDQDTARR